MKAFSTEVLTERNPTQKEKAILSARVSLWVKRKIGADNFQVHTVGITVAVGRRRQAGSPGSMGSSSPAQAVHLLGLDGSISFMLLQNPGFSLTRHHVEEPTRETRSSDDVDIPCIPNQLEHKLFIYIPPTNNIND